MNHRIAADVIVEHEGRFLLVRHHRPGVYDFWVAPGGGAEGDEDLRETARREVVEECGLQIEAMQLAYVEELWNPHQRICKLWFSGRLVGGSLDAAGAHARAEHIVDAAWLAPKDFAGLTVFPAVLPTEYWQDRDSGFAVPRYLGLRKMEFW